jgi:NADPH-dependent ferric siderophore reductase
MSGAQESPKPVRIRREPPQFRDAEVRSVEPIGPRLVRVTFTGPDLGTMVGAEPAASVRLLLPPGGTGALVMPAWNGNEFKLADGRRPAIRTFTPLDARAGADTLALEVVLHGSGVASAWAAAVERGSRAAISGPGRGYTITRDAPAYLVGGDESAIPAVGQLLEALPAEIPVHVYIEVEKPEGRITLTDHPNVTVVWCDLPPDAPPGDALVAAIRAADLVPDLRVWVAGEAAGVQRVRRYLFEERELARAQTSIRGYWKHGRAGETGEA